MVINRWDEMHYYLIKYKSCVETFKLYFLKLMPSRLLLNWIKSLIFIFYKEVYIFRIFPSFPAYCTILNMLYPPLQSLSIHALQVFIYVWSQQETRDYFFSKFVLMLSSFIVNSQKESLFKLYFGDLNNLKLHCCSSS